MNAIKTPNPKRFVGAPPGNQNAAKAQTKTPRVYRLPNDIIALIERRSAELGISMAKYIEALVRADNT